MAKPSLACHFGTNVATMTHNTSERVTSDFSITLEQLQTSTLHFRVQALFFNEKYRHSNNTGGEWCGTEVRH